MNFRDFLVTALLTSCSAQLRVHPDRLQFFRYDSVTLTCEADRSSSGWTLLRNTSSGAYRPCGSGWGMSHESSCTIRNVYPSDTGVYWCESEQGESSSAVSILVTDGVVILESPALPVPAGDKVTLLCSHEEQDGVATADSPTKFFRNGVLIGTPHGGRLTLLSVSKSDEGFYECDHPVKAKSPRSWLAVRGPAEPLLCRPLLVCLLCLLLLVVCNGVCLALYRRKTAKLKQEEELLVSCWDEETVKKPVL